MKVALLSDCYLPRLGGIEVQTHGLAAQLRARGHEVEVFTATPADAPAVGGDGEVDEVDGVPVHRLALRLAGGVPVNPFAPRRLRRELGRFDVAHIQSGVVSPFAFDATRVALGSGVPTTITWHCMFGGSESVFRAARFVRGWAGRGAAMNAVSTSAARPLQRIVGAAGEVRVLPNGIDVAEWAPRPGEDRRTAASRPVRVVSAMRLAPRKRPVQLLRLMTRVRRFVPDSRSLTLEIIGEGGLRRELERFIASNDLADWVRLSGRLSRPELRRRYLASDLYVAPARLESFGIAALEARTAGLPVVGHAGSGVGDFVSDGVTGYLADGDDGMAAAVARLVTDDALRERISGHNAGTPPAQDWDRVVSVAEGEYARAVRLAEGRR